MRMLTSPLTGITLLAVLCVAMASAGDNGSSARRAAECHHPHRSLREEEQEATTSWRRSQWQEMQAVLRREGAGGSPAECCPSVVEMVAPKGGRTPSGLFVELYEDGENKQRLYEISCAPDVVDRPCRFVDLRLYNQSRCVQKYSYSYALVRSPVATESPHRARREGHFPVPGGWSMDYVRVRAGCECQLTAQRRRPAAHRKRPDRPERHRQRKRKRLQDEDHT